MAITVDTACPHERPDFSPGPLHRLLAGDHRRLDALLRLASEQSGEINRGAYSELRAALLKHIGMEEKILLPAAQRARGGEPLPIAGKLRLDHGAIAALLVPTPTPAIIAALQAILTAHNAIEEDVGGLYDSCDRLTGAGAAELVARLRDFPEVRVASHCDGPKIMAAARRALARAGFNAEFGG